MKTASALGIRVRIGSIKRGGLFGGGCGWQGG
jgi:hypothetical protein